VKVIIEKVCRTPGPESAHIARPGTRPCSSSQLLQGYDIDSCYSSCIPAKMQIVLQCSARDILKTALVKGVVAGHALVKGVVPGIFYRQHLLKV
jgi:hypothetical protein